MAPAQQLPAPNRPLTGFPEAIIPDGTPVYRAFNVSRSPGFYTSGRGGRFNLVTPRGTLYFASDIDTAVREKVREAVVTSRIISRGMADSFHVAVFNADGVRGADLAHVAAARFGVTRELGTMDDYTVTRAWAAAFDAEGFDGVHYGSRFTTGQAAAWAVFGAEGETDLCATSVISGDEACQIAHITVAGPIVSAESADILE